MSVLKDTKVGDELILRNGPHPWRVVIVSRVMTTRVIAGADAFMRGSGKRVGDGEWSRCFAEPATPVARNRMAQREADFAMQRRLNDTRAALRSLSVNESNVERIEALLADLRVEAS